MIDSYIERIQPTIETSKLLYTIYEELEHLIKTSKYFYGIDHELVLFGSALNGLFDKFCSDLDLTLIVH
jgi:hypothetical protein